MPSSAEHMRRIRRNVSSESCAQNGRKGYRATVAKYGRFFAIEKLQKYRLDHPSKLEQALIDLLREMDAPAYEREFLIQADDVMLLVDFAWPGRRLAVEVNGELHEKFEHKRKRDWAKAAVLEAEGWRLLILNHRDIARAGYAVDQIRFGLKLTEVNLG